MIASILVMSAVLLTIYIVHVATRKPIKGKTRDLGLLAYREVRDEGQKATAKAAAGRGGRA